MSSHDFDNSAYAFQDDEDDAPCCYGYVTSGQRDHEIDCVKA